MGGTNLFDAHGRNWNPLSFHTSQERSAGVARGPQKTGDATAAASGSRRGRGEGEFGVRGRDRGVSVHHGEGTAEAVRRQVSVRRISSAHFSFRAEVSLLETNLTNPPLFYSFFFLFLSLFFFYGVFWPSSSNSAGTITTSSMTCRSKAVTSGFTSTWVRWGKRWSDWRWWYGLEKRGATRCSIASFVGKRLYSLL